MVAMCPCHTVAHPGRFYPQFSTVSGLCETSYALARGLQVTFKIIAERLCARITLHNHDHYPGLVCPSRASESHLLHSFGKRRTCDASRQHFCFICTGLCAIECAANNQQRYHKRGGLSCLHRESEMSCGAMSVHCVFIGAQFRWRGTVSSGGG